MYEMHWCGCEFAFLLLLWITYVRAANTPSPQSDFLISEEDAHLSVPELIRKYGYHFEHHQVPTEDGYLLGVFRIRNRNGTRTTVAEKQHPVLMVHSLFSSCADYVVQGLKRALAYLAADQGYDVWLGNVRGNRYSRNHQRLGIESREFWNFSFDEHGYYDVPAMIDYILGRTQRTRVHYVGYSQGTMLGLIALATRPAYNEKIVQMQLLSPAPYLTNATGVAIGTLRALAGTVAQSFALFNKYDIFAHGSLDWLHGLLFKLGSAGAVDALRNDIAGANPEQQDDLLYRVFVGHFPAGSSTKQLEHFAQFIRTGNFTRFDYRDAALNRAAYGDGGSLLTEQKSPPSYDLSSTVSSSVRLYYGVNDKLVHPANIARLERELPNLAGSHRIADTAFNHGDFILAKNARSVLYDAVLRNMQQADELAMVDAALKNVGQCLNSIELNSSPHARCTEA